MSVNLQLLRAARINAIMRGVRDTRDNPANLVFLRRTPVVPAFNGEIMARFTGHLQIADLIANDQKAAVYSSGKFFLETTEAPNLKHGQMLTQDQLDQLDAIAGQGIDDPDGVMNDFEDGIMENLLLGVEQRMESILVALACDGFSYDRLGIKMTNVSFGMPANLKITVANPWTDTVNAKPVSDIQFAIRVGQVRYGITYNRITMTRPAFDAMIATNEFQAKARIFLAPNVSFVNLPLSDLDTMRKLAQNTIGIEIEIYDSRYWSQAEDGSIASYPFLPLNQVILSSTQSDNDRRVIDFANGVPTEVKVSQFDADMNGRLPAGLRGPIAYATAEHNPPQVTYWGVAKGFARRHALQATSCLTIAPASGGGSLVDAVPFDDNQFV